MLTLLGFAPSVTSIAQRTASTTLRNSMRLPSPVRLTMRPRCSGDGRIDEIAAQRAKMRQNAILVRPGQATIADDIGDQDRRELSGLAHSSGSPALRIPSRTRAVCAW